MVRTTTFILFGGLYVTWMFVAAADRAVEGAVADDPVAIVESEPRFGWVDVFIDSGEAALAAYQFELSAEAGDVRIVGIEGGGHEAFAAPPYYDERAMQHDHVIVGAFNTGEATALPVGRVRVARIHVRVEGDRPAEYVARLQTAGDVHGEKLDVQLIIEEGRLR